MSISAISILAAQQIVAQNNVTLDLIKQNADASQAIADILVEALNVAPSNLGSTLNLAA